MKRCSIDRFRLIGLGVVAGLLLVSGIGCYRPLPLQQELRLDLDKAMPSGTVNMAELADFTWDELYIFGPYTSQDEIAVALGRPWSDTSISHRDDITLLLFVRRGQPYAYLNYSRMAGDFAPVARLTPYTPAEAVFTTRLEDNRYIVEQQNRAGESGR